MSLFSFLWHHTGAPAPLASSPGPPRLSTPLPPPPHPFPDLLVSPRPRPHPSSNLSAFPAASSFSHFPGPPPFPTKIAHLVLRLPFRISSSGSSSVVTPLAHAPSHWRLPRGWAGSGGFPSSLRLLLLSAPRPPCVAALPGPLALDCCSSCRSAVSWKEAAAAAGAPGGGGEEAHLRYPGAGGKRPAPTEPPAPGDTHLGDRALSST
ncbi:uncharacterized protein [Notamacropus eugenii]|uniref:uncharacterized protein n=1 Tax=Notamacropus eugenii TaxID=9315 RepID=UPI003B66B2DF